MSYFDSAMSGEEPMLYIRGPGVPTKDVGKRLPPTNHKLPSTSPQLISIKESSKEAVTDKSGTCMYSSPPSATSGSDRSVRKRPNVSLFPDPTRHQFTKTPPQLRITIPPPPERQESKIPQPKGRSQQCASATPADDGLTGLARAKQRALEARKGREDPSPIFEELNRQVQNSKTTSPTRKTGDGASISSDSSSKNLRRKWTTRGKRRSRSLESFFVEPGSALSSTESTTTSSCNITSATIQSSSSQTELSSSCITKSSQRLQAAVDLKPSPQEHRRRPSNSSILSQQSPSNNLSSDESNSDTTRRKHVRGASSGSLSRLPAGMSPAEAAKSLPSSVKNALGSHAQSESMGYLVLLPHEVVLLNDEHLGLEKQIDAIKKELNAVRYQSAQLHEKMLDELRVCAGACTTDSAAVNKLLHLQIDVATVEVRLDHTSRRLAKTLHRRAEVRERLLMHLAGTHAMLECEKQSQNRASTPPASPVQMSGGRI